MRDRSRQGQLRSEELQRKFANVPRGVLLAVALLTSNGSNGRSAIIDYSRSWLRKASTRRKGSVTPRRPKTEGYCKKRWKMMEGIFENRNKIWTDFTSRMQPRRSRSNWFHTCSLSAQANRSYCMTFHARIDQSLRVRDLQCSFHSGSKVGMPKKCPRKNAQEMPKKCPGCPCVPNRNALEWVARARTTKSQQWRHPQLQLRQRLLSGEMPNEWKVILRDDVMCVVMSRSEIKTGWGWLNTRFKSHLNVIFECHIWMSDFLQIRCWSAWLAHRSPTYLVDRLCSHERLE